jgi:cytochrome P450 family 142 subfamily A polypeptide 1
VKVNLLDRAFYAGDPHPAFAQLRANEPVYHDDETGLWALLRHDDVAWADKRTDLFSSASGSRPRSFPQPSMIDCDDPLHKRRRSLVDKGFHPRAVANLEQHVRSIATDLIDAVAQRGSCDLVADLAAPLPSIMIGDLLGMRREDYRVLQGWSDAMIAGADGPENTTPSVLQAFADFSSYMNETIAQRRTSPREDVISILVHAEMNGERLSGEELIGESLLILIGGNETTRHSISGGIEALLRHPEQRARLARDPALLRPAVEECLRWVTPIANMARTAVGDVEVRGRTIPAGDQVLLMYISANRDEAVFDDPFVFDVAREPNPHISFGMGAHFCLGASLARLEIRVMLEELLRRLPDLALADEDAPVERTRSSFIRGIRSLPVVFTAPG